jgi:hypothetical protein
MNIFLSQLNRFTVILIPGLLMLFSGDIYSQSIGSSVNQTEINFKVRTKQFNEFIDRFNYKTDFNSKPADSLFRSKISRDKILASLFDLKDPRIQSDDKIYLSLKNEFITDVTSGNSLIYKYSDNIIAEAKSRVLVNGKPGIVSVFLTQEIVGKDRVKWVINTVMGDILNFQKTDTTMIRFIPPSSNETDFMNLKRALEDTDYLYYYATKDYSPDNLTLFFYLVKTSVLKFEYTEEVTYHILDIPGWNITVREFNRNEMNSGWLITNIGKNKSDKESFLRNLK